MSVAGRVSVVATVKNEGDNIDHWLDGLVNLSRLPDEIIIVDGGSTDETVARIETRATIAPVPIVLITAPGANISRGRNLGIQRASGDVIAVTDAGTRADTMWLERLSAPLLAGTADVASGFFVPRLASRWERALAATTLPDVAEVDPTSFLPSSRSMAFKRSWFDAGVRYPEWLDYCEDLVWDLAMQRAGARFEFVPDAVVSFAVRPTAHSFAGQYFRYARGDGKAGLFARRHTLRYLTYCGLAIILRRRRAPELSLATALGAAYVARPLIRLWRRDRVVGRSPLASLTEAPLTIALRGVGDVAKMAGYPVGLVWRLRRLGALGWRTTWRRISPDGDLFQPAAMPRGSRQPEGSPGAGSRGERR